MKNNFLANFSCILLATNLSINFNIIEARATKLEVLSCPNSIEDLTNQMLLDLPSYANRVRQRSRSIVKDKQLLNTSYIVIAGRAEFQPLTIDNSEYKPQTTDSSQQVFFTTLEREYRQDRIVETQNYHWLFLTQNNNGWQIVTLFSRFGIDSNSPENNIILPPQDTTNGAIGSAISLWLKDCNAGTVRR